MKVSLDPISTKTRNYNPNFKSDIVIDIGGSQREGSCKVRYATTGNDEEIFSEHATVNDLGRTRFKDPADFVSRIVTKIKKVQNVNEAKVESMGLPEEENIIQNVAIFLPSYTLRDLVFYFPNLRNANDKPLKDIDFSHFREKLQENGVKVSDNMQFKVLQDAMGTGLAMTKRLYDLGMLHEGDLYTACITGGGCGISNIEVVDSENVIIKSSGSSYLSQSLSLQKVSKAGASAPALIENFCRAMGFNEEVINDIKSCHKAEFVLNPIVKYDKNQKTEDLKEFLVDTGKFEIVEEDEDYFIIKIKDAYTDKYNTSRRNAIDKYCLALARLAIIKKTEGSNGMIVTGMVAKSVDRTARLAYNTNLAEWVMQHLTQSFNSYELDKMQAAYDFKVLCDDRFFIDNNTECKKLVHLADFVGKVRSNWLRLNIKHLADAVPKVKV